jgi:hypothetical protein
LLLGLALSFLAGCQKQDEIVRYTVARPPQHQVKLAGGDSSAALDLTGGRQTADQLVGAIVPRGATTWFFKLTGPSAAVESQSKSFVQFIKSIHFEEKGPVWGLPAGWEEEPGSAMRYATLRIATEQGRLELSVIPLPTGEGDVKEYLLSNVNRWRDQMGLDPIAREDLPEATIEFEIDEMPAWLTTFKGRLKSQGMGAPFAGGAARSDAARPVPPGTSNPRDSLPFTSQVPEGWRAASAGPMQMAKYEVRDGDQEANITVSTAGGDLAANVNRWRGQVQLKALDARTLETELRKIKVDGNDAVWVALVGPEESQRRETILGVIVNARGQQWFIKLKGDAVLAARETTHFEEFVQSIRFRKE